MTSMASLGRRLAASSEVLAERLLVRVLRDVPELGDGFCTLL